MCQVSNTERSKCEIMNFEMSDEKDSVGAPIDSSQVEADGESNTSLQPMHMQLFSTWEVRKAPVNCVPR